VEVASFVETEPSKVVVRYIGQILHYKRNHLPPTAEIIAVHPEQNIFLKSLHTDTMPHLITLVLTPQPAKAKCVQAV